MTEPSAADERFGLPMSLDWGTTIDGAQWQQLSTYYRTSTGQGDLSGLGFLAMMADLRPDAVKRYRLGIDAGRQRRGNLPDAARSMNSLLDHLLAYYRKGILYDLQGSRERGARKDEIAHLLTIAWMLGGNQSVHLAADVAGAELAAWSPTGDETPLTWPGGWAPDAGAWACGIDWTIAGQTNELTADDLDRIETWHRDVEGRVPDYVGFLAGHNPLALKTYRARFENTMHGPLPKQFVALLVLSTVTRHESMLRALSTARKFGVAREHVISTLTRPRVVAAGLATRTDIDLGAVTTILDSWDG